MDRSEPRKAQLIDERVKARRPVSANSLAPRLRSRLEPLLQAPHVFRHLASSLPADEERHQKPADPVASEVEIDGYPRLRAVREGLNEDLHDCPDRAVDAAVGPPSRRIVLRDRRVHLAVSATDGPDRRAFRPDTGWRSIHVPAHDALLPLRESARIGDVREHLLRRARNLGSADNRRD